MLARVSAPLGYIDDSALDAGRCRWTKARGGVSPGRFLLSGHPCSWHWMRARSLEDSHHGPMAYRAKETGTFSEGSCNLMVSDSSIPSEGSSALRLGETQPLGSRISRPHSTHDQEW